MSFLTLLQDLGDRLGILERVDQPDSHGAAKIRTRTVSLDELSTEIRGEEVRALADLPAELAVPFTKIFESAGIQPAVHGWNVDRLKQLLLTDAFKDKERAAVQKAILHILNSEEAQVEDLVRDAMARDKALDAFEDFARRKMEDRMAARERRMAEIESQIRACQSELSGLKETMKAEQEKWQEWRGRKRAQERELAWAIGYLIDRKVITSEDSG